MDERNFEIMVGALKDILDEIREMRKDHQEAQAVISTLVYNESLKVDDIEFNKSYEG